jgi:ankyrin repeat protein
MKEMIFDSRNIICRGWLKIFMCMILVPFFSLTLYAVSDYEFLHAIKSGDAARVKKLIDEGADIYAQDRRKNTPLHLAVTLGKASIVKVLLENMADINDTNNDGITPLYLAVKNKHEEIISTILSSGARIDPNKKDRSGTPLLNQIIRLGNEKVAIMLVEKGAKVNARDDNNYSPLYWAATMGFSDLARLLIEKRADIYETNSDKNSLLHVVKSGAIAGLLIDKGLKPDLLLNSLGRTPLHTAAKTGNFEVAKVLIQKGADINKQAPDGEVALHWAADSGNVDLVAFLIEKGTGVDVLDSQKSTPLMYAAYTGQLDAARLLLQKKANASLVDSYGKTALEWAYYSGSEGTVQLLGGKVYYAIKELTDLGSAAEGKLAYITNLTFVSFTETEKNYQLTFSSKEGVVLNLAFYKGNMARLDRAKGLVPGNLYRVKFYIMKMSKSSIEGHIFI